MLRRILLAAIPAGLIAGGALFLAQSAAVLPLIQLAEQHELRPAQAAPAEDSTAAQAQRPSESEGIRRLAYTLLADLLIGIAYGLLLASALSPRGDTDVRRAVLWGLAGFATFALAPALGLAPELPGALPASLGARQAWWWGTVALTAGGLALIFQSGRAAWMIAGCALLALPHLIGPPAPAELGGTAPGGAAPEALARAFVPASLLASFLFWIVLGAFVGLFLRRSAPAGGSPSP